MTRVLPFVSALSFLGFIAPSYASCPDEGYENRLDATELLMFAGQSIEANSPAPDNENWKEIHCGAGTSGILQKVGQGVNHPTDPQRRVGEWRIQDNTMVYSYDNGPSYQWRIYADDALPAAADKYCWQEHSIVGRVIATGNITATPCISP